MWLSIWFCLFGFQGQSVPDAGIPKIGEVLFQETFNGQIQGWTLATGAGDTPNTSNWQQAFGSEAFEGEGFVMCLGKDHGVSDCQPKSKIYLSPQISTVGFEYLSASFYRKTTPAPAVGKKDNVRMVLISGDQSIPLQERLEAGLAKHKPFLPSPSKATASWQFFGRGFTREEVINLNGVTQIALFYNSTTSYCDDLAIDLVTLRGFQNQTVDAIITDPRDMQGAPLEVEVGQVVPFRAIAEDQTNLDFTFFWRIFELNRNLEVCSFVGSQGSYQFPRPGGYLVTCALVDSEGNIDPTPDQRLINASNELDLDTRITEPDKKSKFVAQGTTVPFTAEGEGPGHLTFLWRVTGSDVQQTTRTFEGRMVNIPFPDPGRYLVQAFAQTDGGLTDPTPATREINVLPALVQITSPNPDNVRREIVIPRNLRILFQGVVGDPDDRVTEFYWQLNPGGEKLCVNETTCPIVFNDSGEYTVALVAKDGEHTVGFDYRKVLVSPELRARIQSPERNMEIQVDESFNLVADISGSAANNAEVKWNLAGKVFQGENVEVPGINRPGIFQVNLLARNPANGFVADDSVRILVYDPDSDVLPQIISPKTDTIVKPGGRVFFDSSFRNARSMNQRPYWEVVKMSTQEVLKTSTNATLGRYTFEEAGVFEVSLFLRGQDGNQFLEKRVITVKTGNPAAFNDNDSPQSAAPMSAGDYYPLNLDREHYYQITIPADGLTVAARINVDGPAKLILINPDGEIVGIREVGAGVHTLQNLDLPAGVYTLVVRPMEADAKRMISFSLSLDVLNPALYFTDVQENQSEFTILGAVNPNGSTAEVEMVAYANDGGILGKVSTQIEGGGSSKFRVLDLFPDFAEQIGWIRVDSTRSLVGFTQINDFTNSRAYAFSAANKLSPELYAPHIAQDLTTWITRASVVNGIAEDSESYLLSGQMPRELENSASYAQDAFDFLEKFGGTLPEGVEWGHFREDAGKVSLAGNEVFSRKGPDQQIVGLNLVEAPSANPNFVNQGNLFYFTHIARDTGTFWTGIALVNIDTVEQSAVVRAYGPGGTFVGEKTITLMPSQKLVSLADVFLDGIGSVENVDWVEIEADPGVTGYEIFGTLNNKQLAGLEAITEQKTSICFPFVDNTGAQWHGFAVVNLTDTDTTVSFDLINDAGDVLESVTEDLPARAKRIFVLAELFNGIPFNAAWVKASAAQPIAGFELFGTDETMSGIIAQ